MGCSPQLCTSKSAEGGPYQTSILNQSLVMSVFYLRCMLMSETLKTVLYYSVELLSVYVGWMLQIDLQMAALVCGVFRMPVLSVPQCRKYLQALIKIDLKRVICLSMLALQKPKLENIQLFPIAVPVSHFISHANTTQTYSVSYLVQHINMPGTTFCACHCVVFICNKTRFPNIKLINIWDSELFARFHFWF